MHNKISLKKSKPALELKSICKSFSIGNTKTPILNNACLSLYHGRISALVAPSGAGKSTLMHIAGLLSKPDSGKVILFGDDCSNLSDILTTKMRGNRIGFVYQQHMLLRELSCIQNVMLPRLVIGDTKVNAKYYATEILEYLGLGHRLQHRPGELSGGERQRCSIARALVNKPDCILADEPTGNLDPETADYVWKLFLKALRDNNAAALIVTHNPVLAKKVDNIFTLENGKIIETQNIKA